MKKNNTNYYKITTIILIIILLIIGFVASIQWYGEKEYKEGYLKGEQDIYNKLILNLKENGLIKIVNTNNNSITLIPDQYLVNQQEQIITQIISEVQQKGFVQIYNNQTELTLVPYTQNLQNKT